jgi:hypothetical protein
VAGHGPASKNSKPLLVGPCLPHGKDGPVLPKGFGVGGNGFKLRHKSHFAQGRRRTAASYSLLKLRTR